MSEPDKRDLRRRDPAAVYRLYGSDGALLYIGSSHTPEERHRAHAKKPWGGEIARREDVWYLNRAKAYEAETVAINTESPKYNVMCTQGYRDACSVRAREDETHRNRVLAGSLAARGASRSAVQGVLHGLSGVPDDLSEAPTSGGATP
ncbi:GIY-YIG nuclease family protein [Streptomyces syringium]|uniref:GIY-YIG nuclease family protein n=1 Tax=Streptomyces syringium TaxID=76729 RepID=UPI00342D2A99